MYEDLKGKDSQKRTNQQSEKSSPHERDFQAVTSFLKSTWSQIPDRSSPFRVMRPRYAKSRSGYASLQRSGLNTQTVTTDASHDGSAFISSSGPSSNNPKKQSKKPEFQPVHAVYVCAPVVYITQYISLTNLLTLPDALSGFF